MKKIFVLMILLMLILVGCTRPEIDETAPAVTTTVPATTEPSSAPTEFALTEAVHNVYLQSGGDRMELYPLDYRTAAFVETTFDAKAGKIMTRIRVVDLYTGEVAREELLNGEWSLLPQGGCDGYIFLTENITAQIRVLDSSLQQVWDFEGVGEDGMISADLNTYYYLLGDQLYAMDRTSGQREQVTIEPALSIREIQGYDPEQNILFLSIYSDPYGARRSVCAVDPTRGVAVFLNGSSGDGGITDSGYCLVQEDLDDLMGDLSYCSWDGSVFWTIPDFLANNTDYSTWHIPGTDYLYRISYDKALKADVVKAELFRLGQTLTVCVMEDPLDGTKLNRPQGLPDGNLLLVAATRGGYQIYVVVPQLLTFTESAAPQVLSVPVVDETVLQGNGEGMLEYTLSDAYSGVRETADRLEEEYEISILLSSQCSALADNDFATMVTTDKAGLDNEIGYIEDALADMETALKMYPTGFFGQFRKAAGERGLLVLLVKDIATDIDAIGVCYMLQNWYVVAVDVTSGYVLSTYCHEFWHATENKINRHKPQLLSDMVWSACNPEGYEYSYDTSGSYIEDVENTFYWETDERQIYFIDPYGKTKPREDRARLMEYVMAMEAYSQEICRIPALRKKLQIMSDAIREVFDTTGWETPYWERYF